MIETQSESNGATVGGGGSDQYQVSGSYFHHTHWYHVINNKHIVQMCGWGLELICAINIPVGVSTSDMYSHEDTHDDSQT